MSLFKKKKEDCCCSKCNAEIIKVTEAGKSTGARVKILGSGCTKCNQLEENALKALKQLKMDTAIDHVTDFSKIASYGVMTTPALVLDGKVISFGKVLTAEEVAELLKKER